MKKALIGEIAVQSVEKLFPVILDVHEAVSGLTARLRVTALSRLTRRAVCVSAQQFGARLDALEKDDDGVPLPSNGFFWSVTHKPRYVAGVVASHPVGIDIEYVKPRSASLFRKVASDREWALAGGKSSLNFYRFWTAKEAVLKAGGVGLSGLSRCRVTAVPDSRCVMVRFDDRHWPVTQLMFDDHIAAVTAPAGTALWVCQEFTTAQPARRRTIP